MSTAPASYNFQTEKAPWWLILMGGIFNILIGFLLITVPVQTVVSLVFALGLYWVFSGIFILVGMFVDRSQWGWKLFAGLLSISSGMWIVRYPLISSLTIPSFLILLMGVQGIVFGIINLVLAFKGGGWGIGILGGLSIFFGGILMANAGNLFTIAVLTWMVAGLALVGGIIQVVQAIRER